MTDDALARIAAIEPHTEIDKMVAELDAQHQARVVHPAQRYLVATSGEDEAESDARTLAALERSMNLDLADLADDDIFLA